MRMPACREFNRSQLDHIQDVVGHLDRTLSFSAMLSPALEIPCVWNACPVAGLHKVILKLNHACHDN
jgi:hypothetical protein